MLLRGKTRRDALDALGLYLDCCRTTMLTYVDVAGAVLNFDRANELKPPDDSSHDYIIVHRPKPRVRQRDALSPSPSPSSAASATAPTMATSAPIVCTGTGDAPLVVETIIAR